MDPVDAAGENLGEVLAAFGRGNYDVAGEIAWYGTLGRHLDDADPGPLEDCRRQLVPAVVDNDGLCLGIGHGRERTRGRTFQKANYGGLVIRV